ncbi:MAG: glycosyltransferase family 2 protein [Thermoproteota archaeon]|nr:glycosyltransferase family 2 protein [Thermoproteota archaeon]
MKKKMQIVNDNSLPLITIQLPIYNEKYVAVRLIDAVCRIDYPKEKLQIQILDDSDDNTGQIIRLIVDHYTFKGFDIVYLHRTLRSGYKAGALKAGMKIAKGEFIAIFDADFIPPNWFLKKAIGSFSDPKVGLVQCRWGHINENYSSLTEAQAISLDLHFLIEQKAKSLTHLFMNFNGTAGIWRTSCINDAGGWHTSTLVEDLDLSYRAQLKGWKCLFLENLIIEAELPVQINAAKRQQFRWAKGSMQVAMKLLTDVALDRKIPMDTKIQAFIQLTRHIVHPLFLTQFIIFPMLLALDYKLYTVSWAPITAILMYIVMGPATYLYIIRKIWRDKWKVKARQYFYLIFFATGISVNNTVAIFEALLVRKNEFLRTPKFGIIKKGDEWKNKSYVLPFTKITLLEIFFSVYGTIAIFISIFTGNPIYAPILLLQTIGFIYIAYLSVSHSLFNYHKSNKRLETRCQQDLLISKQLSKIRETNIELDKIENTKVYINTIKKTTYGKSTIEKAMTSRYYRLMVFIVLGFLAFGAVVAFYGYENTIYPLDKAVGYLSRAEGAQSPEAVADYIKPVKYLIPNDGNPVWVFPNPRTDFGAIQNELDAMLSRANSISSLELDSAAYNTGLADLRNSIKIIESNLIEATPYLYVSFTNIILSAIWIAIILFIFAMMNRGRAKFKEYENA